MASQEIGLRVRHAIEAAGDFLEVQVSCPVHGAMGSQYDMRQRLGYMTRGMRCAAGLQALIPQ